MNDSFGEPVDYELYNGHASEHVPQKESTAPALATEVIVDDTKTQKDAASQQHTHLPQLDGEGTDAHKTHWPEQLLSVSRTTGNSTLVTEEILPQPNMQLLQRHKADADTDQTVRCIQQPCTSHSQATGNSRVTTEGIPTQPDLRPLLPSGNEINTAKKPHRLRQHLFVPDVTGDTPLTIEDIYIEAMTLAAEVRIHRRQLDDKKWAKLTKIMEFCHDALHEKLVLSALAKRANGQQTVDINDNLTVTAGRFQNYNRNTANMMT